MYNFLTGNKGAVVVVIFMQDLPGNKPTFGYNPCAFILEYLCMINIINTLNNYYRYIHQFLESQEGGTKVQLQS